LTLENDERIQLFDGLTLDTARGCVVRSGEPIHLRPQTYEVLRYLAENRGHLIGKDRLIEEVWKGRAVTDDSLGKCIKELREALGPDARENIRNVHGRGYILERGSEAPREREALSTRSEQVEVVRVTIEDHEEISDLPAPRPRTTATRSMNSWRIAAIAAGVLVLALAGFAGYRFFSKRAAVRTSIKSIAVLPFKNESGSPDVEYLSEGMTESLINDLSRISSLSVKARSSVFRYRGKEIEPQRVAVELSVQAILNGRVVQRGDDLTLYLSLIDGATGNQIWGERYDRKSENLVALQRDIVRDVLEKLRGRLAAGDEQRVIAQGTNNPEAQRAYLKGRPGSLLRLWQRQRFTAA
jgi:TolB-like protein/DNA-binding winged helix-turn-helix (wHTH) protein